MQSINNLFMLMEKKAIYSLKPTEIIRMCIGNRCEFCHQYINEDKGDKKRLTTLTRDGFGVESCWNCVKEKKDENGRGRMRVFLNILVQQDNGVN